MKALASFVMQTRLRAVTATAGFGIGFLLLPPLAMVSNACLSLVCLRAGLVQALWVGAGAVGILALLAWVLGLSPLLGVFMGLVQWLPTVALAQILRHTASWALTLLGAALLGIGGVLLLHLAVADLPGVWLEILENTLGPFLAQTGMPPVEVSQNLLRAAELMSGILAMAMVLNMAVALVIARYWQAALYNPGGFAQEFQALQLGRIPALILLALLLGSWLGQSNLLTELALIMLALFFLQGLALVHALCRSLKMHRAWLVSLYVLLLFAFPQMMVILSTFAALDAFVHFRHRLPPPPPRDADPSA